MGQQLRITSGGTDQNFQLLNIKAVNKVTYELQLPANSHSGTMTGRQNHRLPKENNGIMSIDAFAVGGNPASLRFRI